MNIKGVYHVNINCSALEKSRAFYEMLGFKVQYPLQSQADPVGAGGLAAALGLPRDAVVNGYMMQLGDSNGCRIDLLRWDPYAGFEQGKPTDHMMNLGLQRLNIWTRTEDFEADIAEIKAYGVEVVGEPMDATFFGAPCKVFAFKDPDGTVIELSNVDPSYAS
jgi:catechol 2,3-dioxygenase-like lactoylglutathione lyase family enzyme